MDRPAPAVVWERDDQMSGPSGGRATSVDDGDGERLPMARGQLASAPSGRVTARDGLPVVLWWSWKVACREAPLNHPGDTRLRGQAGDGVNPRGAVAAVPTTQADREFCHAHQGMGAWMAGWRATAARRQLVKKRRT